MNVSSTCSGGICEGKLGSESKKLPKFSRWIVKNTHHQRCSLTELVTIRYLLLNYRYIVSVTPLNFSIVRPEEVKLEEIKSFL